MIIQPDKWPVVHDRFSYIRKIARGWAVLDVGCVGKKADGRIPDPSSTLHAALKPVCSSLLGVDSDPEGVRRVAEAGFDVVCGDIVSMDLGQTFDVIIAGEVIEHLLDAGSALRNLGKHLKRNGRLVITTCNPFYYRQQSKIARHGHIQVHRGHTAWYDPQTLSVILESVGFTVMSGIWLAPQRKLNLMSLVARWRKYWNPSFLVEARLKE